MVFKTWNTIERRQQWNFKRRQKSIAELTMFNNETRKVDQLKYLGVIQSLESSELI